MATYEVYRGNEYWPLSGGSLCYRVSTTNLGLPPIRRLRQRGPFQQGVSDRGFRLDERTLLLELFFQATSLADADTRRDTLAEIFKPTSVPLKLRVTRDDGQVRQIDCYAEGVIDFPDTPLNDRVGVSQRVVASVYCPEPVWYNPTLRTLSFGSLVGDGLEVPASIPWISVSAGSLNRTEAFDYIGNWSEFPTITLVGPGTSFVVTNLSTDEKLDFTGATLAGGETYTIDLRYEYQTVTSSVHGDVQANLTADSDLATWHLAANPEVADGVNTIQVAVASGFTTATQVFVQYYERYISA